MLDVCELRPAGPYYIVAPPIMFVELSTSSFMVSNPTVNYLQFADIETLAHKSFSSCILADSPGTNLYVVHNSLRRSLTSCIVNLIPIDDLVYLYSLYLKSSVRVDWDMRVDWDIKKRGASHLLSRIRLIRRFPAVALTLLPIEYLPCPRKRFPKCP